MMINASKTAQTDSTKFPLQNAPLVPLNAEPAALLQPTALPAFKAQ